jgi:Cytochrome c7 and related cytochrome c/Class III cytochrome C family
MTLIEKGKCDVRGSRVRPTRVIAASCLVWATVVVPAGTRASLEHAQAASLAGDYQPPPPPEQPIPYSHKTHLALGLRCAACHETASSDEHATLPPTSTCMGCHAKVKTDSPHIQALKAWHDRDEPVPWRRVYRLPTFVYFSHMQHVADAQVTCDVCHGDVAQMDVVQKVKDTSMSGCVDCHKSRSAPDRCDSCHETL